MLYIKREEENQINDAILELVDKRYDPTMRMTREWRGENGYHSRLVNQFVHSTREAFLYAYELMNRGREEDIRRAIDILYQAIPLQDTDQDHDTYGLWSYFAEESLEEMSPPDWNWADFCGKTLLQIVLEYGGLLPEELRKMASDAVLHACNSIKRRDVGPHYTNISVMGTLVTLAAGENLGIPELMDYARERLKKLHAFNIGHGAFQEYNSPTYTWIVLEDISSMSRYIKEEESRAMLEELSDLAWRCIAEHFHYRSGQWAGPHRRFYAMLEDDQLMLRIQRAMDYQICPVPLDKKDLAKSLPLGFFSSSIVCPKRYRTCFTTPNKDSKADVVFLRSEQLHKNLAAVCRLSEKYTLGTFYKSVLWNQRRSHLSYFGTKEAPVYCGLKCLHDGYDYSSGTVITAQDGMRAVSVVGFLLDGGDTHPSLDRVKEGTIWASDLRIRFEIGGAAETVQIEQSGGSCFLIRMPDALVRISAVYAAFGDRKVFCEITEEMNHINETGDHKEIGDVKCVDIVLYHGEQTKINFAELNQCACAISFEIIAPGEVFTEPEAVQIRNGLLMITQGNLKAEAPVIACETDRFEREARAYRDGREYRSIYQMGVSPI